MMKTKYNIGNSVNIKMCDLPGLIININYEVAWSDKDGSPCKGTFTQVELDRVDTKRSFGFNNENS